MTLHYKNIVVELVCCMRRKSVEILFTRYYVKNVKVFLIKIVSQK